MRETAWTIGLAIALMVPASGCSSLSWATPWSTARPAASGQPSDVGADTDSTDVAMQSLMAELQQLGALDPEAQAALMEDLRQTDPELWPVVAQQFRTALAYRRQMAERTESGQGVDRQSVSRHSVDAPGAVRQASATLPIDPQTNAGHVARLPAADNAALAPGSPREAYPTTPFGSNESISATWPNETARLSGEVRQVSNTMAPLSGRPEWRDALDATIGALESGLDAVPDGPDEVAQHARLRMLYLLAGRRDDAVAPIPSVPPATQEYWSKQIYSLATWLDTQRTTDDATRAAEAKRILEEAVARLGESASLVVRNMAFCTEVQSYGCVKRFTTDEFAPGQETLLYAEVENFASESTADGYHTTLRSSYQIFDSRGQRVAEHTFTDTEEYCQNPRRDFFIGYRLTLPNRIYPGKHTLQLTIEDTMSQKVGQSSIEFSIDDTEG